MRSALAAVSIDSGTVLVLIALLAVPFAAFSFSRAGAAYRSIGRGPMAIDDDLPAPRHASAPEPGADPAIQMAEVRQMLQARADRLQRRGEAAIDVEAETARLLEPADEAEIRRQLSDLIGSP
jgi:hypothetical protein